MKKAICVLILTLANFAGGFAQINQPERPNSQPVYNQPADPLQNISQEISRISGAVQKLNKGISEWIEKMAVGKGMQLSERQQKLLLGFEVLNRAEQRVEILQKFQIELTQKEAEVKTRAGQIEENLLPDSIERNSAFIPSTRTEELRQGRRQTLENERRSLQGLLVQIRRNQTQTEEELRQAEMFVSMLRRKVLPQIEAEVSGL